MKLKSYNYNQGDITEFKKYIGWLIVCALASLSVLALQSFLLINANKRGVDLSTGEMIAGYGCIIFALIFLVFMIIEIIRHCAIIKKINKQGTVEIKNISLNYSKKFAFGNIVRFFDYLILTITSIFVVAFTTYGVYNYWYYSTVNYYIPIALFLLVSTFYATKMLEHKYALEKQ